jgi:predicted CXXCH cytochrome family protein
MQEATERSVLGKFDGGAVANAGVTSTFLTRDAQFIVRTDGPDGRIADFPVKYTFGVAPLQQYLVELPGGRLQALGTAWDTRTAAAGGQRWFHLYPGERLKAGDPLHWTGLQQNWNFMCADCHSTNLRKGYTAETRTFRTTWSEIGVGCEACHGPGSRHAERARDHRASLAAGDSGLTARLDERKGVSWTPAGDRLIPVRSHGRDTDREIDVCARCHARRSQLTDTAKAGDRFEDGFRADLLTAPLYWSDGQQKDEVYTYGSFLQSRMYAKGVTCSDCHDPHAGTLRQTGNALCTSCHAAARFDNTTHTGHPPASAGSSCVACHMPAATYMQIDVRHDHSFRVPRPDRTATMGTPNACTSACHRERDAVWAAQAIAARGAAGPAGFQTFAEAFHGMERPAFSPAGHDPAERLAAIVRDAGQPAIVRASALERLAAAGLVPGLDVVTAALDDPSSLVRRAALEVLQPFDVPTRLQLAPPLLSDPVRGVRLQAVVTLADVPAASLPLAFGAAFDEFVASQRYNADRPEAQVTLGTVLAGQGQFEPAIAAMREALALNRTFLPAYVNLADLYRTRGDEAAAERTLREALAVDRDDASVSYALALTLVRQGRRQESLSWFAKAAASSPETARYAYAYAVALHDLGHAAKAIGVLEQASRRHPGNRDILTALQEFLR